MIESVFLSIFVLAIIMNLIGWLFKKPIFVAIALMTWLSMVFTNSLNIEVPGDTTYMEQGLQAFVLLFIFIDIIYLVVTFVSHKKIAEYFKGDWGG